MYFTVEMSKDDIEDAIARGMLKPEYDAWNVLDVGMQTICRTTLLARTVSNVKGAILLLDAKRVDEARTIR